MRVVINYTLGVTILCLLIAWHPNAQAAFSLNKTRVIVSAGSSSSIKVTNRSSLAYGMQSWVEEVHSSANELAVTPSLLTLKGKSNTTLRLLSFNKNIHEEQLFYLNVQEIPPKHTNSDASILSLAVRTRIKLLIRPESLFEERLNAEKKIQVIRTSGGLLFRNPTPYYFAVTEVTANNTPIASTGLNTFAPGSEVYIESATLASEVTLFAIDDYGATNSYTFLIKK